VIVQCVHLLVLTNPPILNQVHRLFYPTQLTCCLSVTEVSQAIHQHTTLHIQTPLWPVRARVSLKYTACSTVCTVSRRTISYRSFTFILHRCRTFWRSIWHCCRRGWVVQAMATWSPCSVVILRRLTASIDVQAFRYIFSVFKFCFPKVIYFLKVIYLICLTVLNKEALVNHDKWRKLIKDTDEQPRT